MKASPEQLAALRLVARRLGNLRDDVVFVGGMTTGLLVTNPGAPMARPTKDVDVILDVASTIQYNTKLRKRLIRCGFREDTRENAPLCRWTLEGLAVADGRPELLEQIESDTLELRQFLAKSITSLLSSGLEDQLPGHLPGDAASQARLPSVLTTFRRIARCPRLLKTREKISAAAKGDPGATNVPGGASWDWEILEIEKAIASVPSRDTSHVAVIARLMSHSMTAGTAGDGREVYVEDSMGRRFRPLYKLIHDERAYRNMADPYAQILPREPFETVWVYELPASAKGLRLLLPFDNVELPFERPT